MPAHECPEKKKIAEIDGRTFLTFQISCPCFHTFKYESDYLFVMCLLGLLSVFAARVHFNLADLMRRRRALLLACTVPARPLSSLPGQLKGEIESLHALYA